MRVIQLYVNFSSLVMAVYYAGGTAYYHLYNVFKLRCRYSTHLLLPLLVDDKSSRLFFLLLSSSSRNRQNLAFFAITFDLNIKLFFDLSAAAVLAPPSPIASNDGAVHRLAPYLIMSFCCCNRRAPSADELVIAAAVPSAAASAAAKG